jgi:hypothetical protein
VILSVAVPFETSTWGKVVFSSRSAVVTLSDRRKRMKGPANRGNVWLRGIMGEVAWATVKKRATYFYAQFNRVARRRGRNKAAVAVAHSLLVVIYHVLKTGKPYVELGVDYFDKLDATRIERHHVRRLEQLEAHQSATNQELCKLPIRASRSSRSPGFAPYLAIRASCAWSVIPQILRGRCAASRSTLGRALYPRVRPAPRAQRIFETGAIASRLARVSSCTTMTTFGTKFPTPASMQM